MGVEDGSADRLTGGVGGSDGDSDDMLTGGAGGGMVVLLT